MAIRCGAVLVAMVVVVAACGGGRATPRPPTANAPGSAPATASAQAHYEAGRYDEALAVAGPAAAARDQWFAANSAARLGRAAEVADRLGRLAASGDPAWAVVAGLMRARIANDPADLGGALEASLAFPAHPAVQLERGRGHAMRGEQAEAASAFDRAIEADPRLAYAYYYAALAYDAVGQAALAGTRLETFLRLAPDAPEQPEVRSILGTLGR